MSNVIHFGAAFRIDEKEIEDRYAGKRDEIVEYKKNRQLHELVDKLIEVKGDELWQEEKSVTPDENFSDQNVTDYYAKLFIFTPKEMKEYREKLLKI